MASNAARSSVHTAGQRWIAKASSEANIAQYLMMLAANYLELAELTGGVRRPPAAVVNLDQRKKAPPGRRYVGVAACRRQTVYRINGDSVGAEAALATWGHLDTSVGGDNAAVTASDQPARSGKTVTLLQHSFDFLSKPH